MAYQNGVVTVGTSAQLVVTVGTRGALVQNVGGTTIYLGGPSVTADTSATGGVQLASGATSPSPIQMLGGSTELQIGGTVSDSAKLYAISSAAGGKLAFVCESTSY